MPAVISPKPLPPTYNSFIGRAREVVEAQSLLSRTRLVTITGPGGVGKTRLALQAATEISATFGPVYWCDLASVAAPELVADAAVAALGLSPAIEAPPLETLLRALRNETALIVLDNCEHVLTACAALVAALLQGCPSARFLTTSQQPLGLPQESVLFLSAFEVPSAGSESPFEELSAFDAVRLFAERAAEARPDFSLNQSNIASALSIVRRLDGLPLAIELAAARVKMLEPEQIARRLDNAFGFLTRAPAQTLSRHQTLRAAIDWSYRLLSAAEQALLRRLSVFRGSFSLETAEAVCGEAAVEPSTLDLLTDLVDKSLLIRQPSSDGETVARYHLLELVRRYAREQLEESGEAPAIRSRMLTWAVDWIEAVEPYLNGPERTTWLERFQIDLDNLRAALRWAVTNREIEQGMRLAAGLFRFWIDRSYLTEGRGWLEELLALEESKRVLGEPGVAPLVRAGALYVSGRLAMRQWDTIHAARRGGESLELYRTAGDRPGMVRALGLMALVAQEQNRPEQAIAWFEEALALNEDPYQRSVLLHNLGLLYHEQGDFNHAVPLYRQAIAVSEQAGTAPLGTKGNLADVLAHQGDYALARRLATENLERAESAGETYTIAQESLTLGMIARQQGEAALAEAYYRQALELHEEMETIGGIGQALLGLGEIDADHGRPADARRRYDQALAYLQQAGNTRGIALAHLNLGRLTVGEGAWVEAIEQLRRALAEADRAGDKLTAVAALEELACALTAVGEAEQAARLLGAAAAWRVVAGAPMRPTERPRIESIEDKLRAILGEQNYAAERDRGARASWKSIMAEALEEEQAQPPAEAAVEPTICVFLLGRAQVTIGGQPVTPAAWTYKKARELFFYLVSEAPATKSQIGLDLWPDASPEQLRSQFHRSLHHLRAALGQKEIVVHNSGVYSIAPQAGLWSDLEHFESLLAAAGITRRRDIPTLNDPDRRIGALEEAIGLWRGEFLGDLDAGEWALIRGEALRSAYFKAILALGRLRFARSEYERAIEAYRLALSHDPLLELAYRELMRCYTRLGERGQALRLYLSLKSLLHRELDVPPSSETEALYAQIRRGDDV